MLGLDGHIVLAVSAEAGELEQAIETTAVEDFCRACGAKAKHHTQFVTGWST